MRKKTDRQNIDYTGGWKRIQLFDKVEIRFLKDLKLEFD
jgi:hypothetical protein